MKADLFITTKQGSLVEGGSIFSKPDTGVENQVLNIYSDICGQGIEGFGGALTGASGAVFARMPEKQREEMLDLYFNPEKMGYNQVRIHMDSCDFCPYMYEADSDESDEKLEKFSFAETEKYIIPLLEAAERHAGRKLAIMLSPWSPPAYMKTNQNRKKGGSLKPEYRARWAAYLCRYIEEFQKRGFWVKRMSIQNEPKAVQQWDSCVYTAEEEKIFLRDYLVPAMKERGLEGVELFIWDHNKERIYERARDILDDSVRNLVDGVAFHWYSGDHFEGLDLVRRVFPEKKLILSESCLEFGKYDRNDQLHNAERLAHDMIGNLNHGMCGFYDWNILLDQEGGPNHVGNFCDAPYLYDEEKNALEERRIARDYWHFAHFIKPGAVRTATTRCTDKVDFTAFKNPDGRIAFVLLNRTEEEFFCHMRVDGDVFEVKLEAHGIMSGLIEED